MTVSYPAGSGDPREEIREDFDRLHLRQYGHTMDDPIETTTLRLNAIGIVDKPELPKAARRASGESYPNRSRTVFVEGDTPAEYVLVAREDLRAGDVIDGPAVVTEHTATTVLHEGDRLEVGDFGELVISIKNTQNTQKEA